MAYVFCTSSDSGHQSVARKKTADLTLASGVSIDTEIEISGRPIVAQLSLRSSEKHNDLLNI